MIKGTSTEIASIANLVGERKAVEYVAKAGFTAWDFSMFEMGKINWATEEILETGHPLRGNEPLRFARELRKIGEDNGIHCNQSHAPFPTHVKGIYDKLKTAIECTAEAGGTICVIHPRNADSAEQNANFYREILPFAASHGVKIATENMWNWNHEKDQARICACSDKKSFVEHMEALPDDFFVACLDIGHAEMRGLETSAVELIHALKGRLGALHVHDNDRWHDDHDIPFSMQIDFAAVMKALKETDYDGYLTLEADAYLNRNHYTADNAFDGVKALYESTVRLMKLYNEA